MMDMVKYDKCIMMMTEIDSVGNKISGALALKQMFLICSL